MGSLPNQFEFVGAQLLPLLIKVNGMGVKCFNWGHKHVKIIRTNKIEQPDKSSVKWKKTLTWVRGRSQMTSHFCKLIDIQSSRIFLLIIK